MNPPELGSLSARTFAAVIFDVDGTLIDSTPAVERSWSIWADEFGIDREALAQAHGIPAAATARLLVAPDQVEQSIARIDQIELADLDGVVPLPGALQALAALSSERKAIATSCTRPLLDARLAAAGIEPLEVMVTADIVARGKPAPDPFLMAAERLGVDPSDCLVFEDAPGGLTGARAAGCATIAVTTTRPADQLEADAVVSDLSAIRLVEGSDGITVALA